MPKKKKIFFFFNFRFTVKIVLLDLVQVDIALRKDRGSVDLHRLDTPKTDFLDEILIGQENI